MARDPAFEIELADGAELGDQLLVGLAGVGVAGLTAADYLVTHVETTQVGHVRSRNLPDITPFTEGQPRHPIRLYEVEDRDLTVLLCEVFLPLGVVDAFADAVLQRAVDEGVTELTVFHGSPFPHREEEHVVFHVATEEYRARHFDADGSVGPLAGGFFDGIVGEFLVRSLDGDAPPTGVLVTPTHLPGPDFEAAIRLLGALEPIFGVTVSEMELRERASEMERYYAELAERIQSLQEGGRSPETGDYANDRMYM